MIPAIEMRTDMDGAPIKRTRKATIGRRPADEAELTDSTCTPKWLADILPMFDIDPCSNSRSHIRARHTFSLEAGTDGLTANWIGTAFDNNPFSEPMPWMLKARLELRERRCTGLVALVKNDPQTAWWRVLTGFDPAAPVDLMRPEIWLFHKRIQYDEHPDVIERRRIQRIIKAIAGDPVKGIEPKTREWAEANITGKSSANFGSTIVHHRGSLRSPMPILNLESVATRWVMA